MALPSKETHLKFPFLDLPQDIGRIVFEIAASLDSQTGASCALVSKKVKTWVETVLYCCIRIRQRKTLEYLSRTIRDPSSTKPPGFFASRVKYLAFLGPGSGIGGDIDSLTILKACQGVESLHIWSNIWIRFRERKNFQKFITSPSITLSPRRLFIRDVLSNHRDLNHFGHAIFQNLTHLEVDMSNKWEWDTLRELSCLTHLSLEVDSDMDSRTVSRMVTHFPNSLKIVIFWAPEYLFGVRHTPGSEGDVLDGDEAVEVMKSIQDGQTDQRAVLGDGAGNLKARSERDPQWNLDRIVAWESTNASRFDASRKDSWTLAEEIVERRRLDLATCERFHT